jgi:prepilin-type N-terminal cleavage/methylation domain-containing protein
LGISVESRLNLKQMKMKKLHKGQKGFTLLELLIGIAITALITTAVTMTILQTFTGSTRSSNHMVAVRQVQEAGYWVSFYAYAAQDLTITGDSGFPLTLRWVDFDANEKHKIEFNLDSSGLRGSYYVEVGGVYVLDSAKTGKIPVFGFINSDKTKTNCQVSGGSDFSLPDSSDAFTITGGATPDNGIITRASGSISFTKTGGATYALVTGTTNKWTWTTTTTGDTITVTAASSNTKGSWTSETKAATAAITVDSDGDATLSSARGLIFTVTATVGTGQQEETRIYKVVPKPVS